LKVSSRSSSANPRSTHTLIGIACVHAANRLTLAIAMTLWAFAIVVSLLTIGVQDRPFAGPYRVQPRP
jgi:hypothetical protein